MAATIPGILAIWNDCKPGSEAAFEAWYRGEHLRERVGLPGFVCGRRYTSINCSKPRYFTYYETNDVDVLRTPAYLARCANPTPMTKHIMTTTLQNMSRTVCYRARTSGALRGSVVITASVDAGQEAHLTSAWLQVRQLSAVLRTELWRSAAAADTTPSTEEQLRGQDTKISACLLAEFANEDEAAATLPAIRQFLVASGNSSNAIGCYRFMCSLNRREITP